MLSDFSHSRESQGLSADEVVKFLSDLEFKDKFNVTFTPEFAEKSWKRGTYLVWLEGSRLNLENIQLFYDDDFNEWGPDSDEYPDIICKFSDILKLERRDPRCF